MLNIRGGRNCLWWCQGWQMQPLKNSPFIQLLGFDNLEALHMDLELNIARTRKWSHNDLTGFLHLSRIVSFQTKFNWKKNQLYFLQTDCMDWESIPNFYYFLIVYSQVWQPPTSVKIFRNEATFRQTYLHSVNVSNSWWKYFCIMCLIKLVVKGSQNSWSTVVISLIASPNLGKE